MASGGPDHFGATWRIEVVERPSIVYRSGAVIFVDDFEPALLKWFDNSTGSASRARVTTAAFGGEASLEFSGGISGNEAAASRFFSMTPDRILGFECAFARSDTNGDFIHWGLFARSAAGAFRGRVRFTISTSSWLYLNDSGGYTVLPGITIDPDADPLFC